MVLLCYFTVYSKISTFTGYKDSSVLKPDGGIERLAYWIGIDPGRVRCGVAVAQESSPVATPLTVLDTEPRDTLARRLAAALDQRTPRALVVGLPLDQHGGEGEAAHFARAIGELLAQALDVPLEFIDERFSTANAQTLRRETGAKAAKRRRAIDAGAAALILQGFLDRRTATIE